MNERNGFVKSILGNMITVQFNQDISQNEVGYVHCGDQRLMSEVIKINGSIAYMQVFEDTKGICVGNKVDFSGEMLSVTLGPGLLSHVYDGLQNPLFDLAEKFGFSKQN